VAPFGSDSERLELLLRRRGIGMLEADRDRCRDCGRTPLAGEQVHSYDERHGAIVCELCRPRRREQPLLSRLARQPGPGGSVRLTARAA
jgi:hypothetical protein